MTPRFNSLLGTNGANASRGDCRRFKYVSTAKITMSDLQPSFLDTLIQLGLIESARQIELTYTIICSLLPY